MSFDHPSLLLGLWLLVPLALLLWRAERNRRAAALDFAHAPMVERLLPPLSGPRPWLRAAALLGALGCGVVAAAGPRFGVTFEPVKERGADLLVLLDVSRSMLSRDVAPDRLGRAKSDVRDLVSSVVGHRLGLVAFAGKAVVACPLTTDRGFFLEALERVDPRSAPRGGTAIGDAIRVALQAMPPQRDRDQALLLITDGEDHDSYPLEAAKTAAERGVKLFAVGLGDPTEGARVPASAADGSAAFLKHEGQEVWSKLQEGLLAELAMTTGGAFVPARTSAYDLGEVYREHLAGLQAGEIRSEKRKRLSPRFQLFLGLALALALLERLIGPARRRAPGLAAAALALLATPGFAAAPPIASGGDAPEQVRAALEALREGRHDDALARLADAEAARPGDPTIVFDRACAKEAKGDFDGARADLLTVAAGRDAELSLRAQFNLGALAAKRAGLALGERPEDAEPPAREEALRFVEEAIRHLRACVDADPDHAKARRNLETLRLWSKHMADVWAKRDRAKAREEADLLQLVDWLHEQQGAVRAAARALARESDSPLRRTALEALARRQRELCDELPFLKEKIARQIEQEVAAMQGGGAAPPGSPPPPDPAQVEAALAALIELADGAGASMKETAKAFEERQLAPADHHGKEAQQGFDRLWLAVGSFEAAVGRGVKLAEAAVHRTKPFVAKSEAAAGPDATAPRSPPSDPAAAGAVPAVPAAPALRDDAEATLTIVELDERLVPLAQVLGERAAAMQAQLAQTPVPESAPPLPPDPGIPPDPNAPPDREAPPDPSAPPDPAAQRAALERALTKAIEHGPAVAQLALAAATSAKAGDAPAAFRDEEEALRLLKEIQQELPKSPQQQDPQQPQDDSQEQQEQESKQQEPQQDGEDPQQDSKEQRDPADSKDEAEDDQGEPRPRQPDALTKQQAEALLQKAVERAREKAEELREAQAAVAGPGKVDRDW